MRRLTSMVDTVFAAAGLRVTRRRPPNRFDAMAECLQRLAAAGFDPAVVVDAGANVGQWARLAAAAFPRASVHVIEPQPACAGALERFRAGRRSVEIHRVAVTAPDRDRVHMCDATSGSTGARVIDAQDAAGEHVEVGAATLDELIVPHLSSADRVLLKLDVEGHEIEALKGAASLLARTDAVITEVQFFDVQQDGQPTVIDLVSTLASAGFLFYDVAALASRPRDGRLRMGDLVFVRQHSALAADDSWA